MKKGIFSLAFSIMLVFGATLSVTNLQAEELKKEDPSPTRMVDRDDPYSCIDYAWDCGPLG